MSEDIRYVQVEGTGDKDFPPLQFHELPVYEGIPLPGVPLLMPDPEKHMIALKNLDSRESDILICAYPKSGTHWLSEIVEQLIAGKAEYSAKPKGGAFLEAVDFDNVGLKDMPSPRNLNTHVPFSMLPRKHIELKAKIIHMIRNPKDVAVSLYYHTQRDPFSGCVSCTWGEFLQRFMTNVIYGSWFKYEREWEKAKRETPDLNVYTVHYEDLKLNTEKEIAKIADYLGISYTDDLIKGIADKVDFKNMIKVKAKLDATQLFSTDKKGLAYRKGEIGDWKNLFTVAQNEMFDQFYEKEMIGSELKFTYTV